MTKSISYQRGYRFECKIRRELQDAGYFVLRSAKSGTPIDLVALRKGQVYFIQCKRDGYLAPEEWNSLFDLAFSVNAEPILATGQIRGRREFKCLLTKKNRIAKIPKLSLVRDCTIELLSKGEENGIISKS